MYYNYYWVTTCPVVRFPFRYCTFCTTVLLGYYPSCTTITIGLLPILYYDYCWIIIPPVLQLPLGYYPSCTTIPIGLIFLLYYNTHCNRSWWVTSYAKDRHGSALSGYSSVVHLFSGYRPDTDQFPRSLVNHGWPTDQPLFSTLFPIVSFRQCYLSPSFNHSWTQVRVGHIRENEQQRTLKSSLILISSNSQVITASPTVVRSALIWNSDNFYVLEHNKNTARASFRSQKCCLALH